MAYPEIYRLFPDGPGPAEEVARSFFLDSVDDEAAEAIVEHLNASTAATAVAQLRVLGGAMARVPAEATAFAHRGRRVMAALGAVYERADEGPEHEAWIKRRYDPANLFRLNQNIAVAA
jgi:Berberine and berberine like